MNKDGFLLVDKAEGETSFDVVRRIRRDYDVRKVGHSGTLDPIATGLLIVAIGQGTKLLEYLIGCEKEYEVEAVFGAVSDTYDREGEVRGVDCDKEFSREKIEAMVQRKFLGEINQVPPKFSALKISGKRACDIMREGGDVEMKSRKVDIKSFDILDYEWPHVKFRVNCGSGTYIRSLIHDLGTELGCGGYVKELRRTRVCDHSVNLAGQFYAMEEVAIKFPHYELNEKEYAALDNGGVIKGVEFEGVLMAFYDGRFVGVLENLENSSIKLKKRISY